MITEKKDQEQKEKGEKKYGRPVSRVGLGFVFPFLDSEVRHYVRFLLVRYLDNAGCKLCALEFLV